MARHSGGSFAAYGSPSYVAGAALGNAIGESVRTQQDFSDCMQANGWRPVTPAMLAARQTQMSELRDIFSHQKACLLQVRTNPKYASVSTHWRNLDTGQYSMMQLADQTLPSPTEAQPWRATGTKLRSAIKPL